MFRSVTKKLDKCLSRLEDESLILAVASKSVSAHVTVSETDHDTYWSITQRFLAFQSSYQWHAHAWK
jgi:hypothetical protein